MIRIDFLCLKTIFFSVFCCCLLPSCTSQLDTIQSNPIRFKQQRIGCGYICYFFVDLRAQFNTSNTEQNSITYYFLCFFSGSSSWLCFFSVFIYPSAIAKLANGQIVNVDALQAKRFRQYKCSEQNVFVHNLTATVFPSSLHFISSQCAFSSIKVKCFIKKMKKKASQRSFDPAATHPKVAFHRTVINFAELKIHISLQLTVFI